MDLKERNLEMEKLQRTKKAAEKELLGIDILINTKWLQEAVRLAQAKATLEKILQDADRKIAELNRQRKAPVRVEVTDDDYI